MATKKSKKLTNQQVVDLVNREFENAMGKPGDDISQERALALDYYKRKAFGNEEEWTSSAITSDVMEVIDDYMPDLMRMFTSQDNLVSFDAFSEQDEPKADQESDYVTYSFFKKNEDSFETLFFWCFDALLQKNGYVKCYWDESEQVSVENYRGLTDDELAGLLLDEELEAVERETRMEVVTDPVTGQQVEVTVHDVKFRRVRMKGIPRVESVPPDEFRISGDANRINPGKARMVGHERYVTRGELLEMGFDEDIVNDLPAEAITVTSTEKASRKDKSDDRREAKPDSVDKSQDKILLREAYIKVDMDGDGRAELKQVFVANGEELEIDDIDRQPFHCLPSSPLPHKHFGMATAEKVMDSQLIGSTLLRQILDNLYHTNNPGHGVWEQGLTDGTMDSLLTRKIGAVTPFSRPVNESYAQMTVPFTAGASFPMLEYFDKVKRDRVGVTNNGNALEPDALKHIQQSVMTQVLDRNRAKIELVARIFAETGFKSLFLHIHELLLKHQDKEEIVKLRGSYVPVNPSSWRTRYDMTVQIGLGIGNREQNLLHLDAIWTKQREMAEGGGMNLTVTPKNFYNTAKEFVKNANLKEPALFFTDPGDQKAPPPSSQQEELKKRELALQEQQQKLDMERQQNKAVDNQLKAQKQQIDAQLKMMEMQQKAQDNEDKWAAANEKLRNELASLKLEKEAADADRSLKEAEIDADIRLKTANSIKARAEAAKILAEAEATELETATVESGLDSLLEKDDGESEGA